MSLISKLRNRYFLYVMHSGDDNKKEQLLRKRIAFLGENTRIYSDEFGSEPWLLSIGNNVIIASGVSFVEHDASYYTALRYLKKSSNINTEKMGAIIIEDNCFIGANSLILGGSKIGKNSIIAAGAVVHGIVPSGEVWGGVPARYIMKIEEYANKVTLEADNLPWSGDNNWGGKQNKICQKQIFDYYKRLLNKG